MKEQLRALCPGGMKERFRILCTFVLLAYLLFCGYIEIFQYDWYLAHEAWFAFPYNVLYAAAVVWCARGWSRRMRCVVLLIAVPLAIAVLWKLSLT